MCGRLAHEKQGSGHRRAGIGPGCVVRIVRSMRLTAPGGYHFARGIVEPPGHSMKSLRVGVHFGKVSGYDASATLRDSSVHGRAPTAERRLEADGEPLLASQIGNGCPDDRMRRGSHNQANDQSENHRGEKEESKRMQ